MKSSLLIGNVFICRTQVGEAVVWPLCLWFMFLVTETKSGESCDLFPVCLLGRVGGRQFSNELCDPLQVNIWGIFTPQKELRGVSSSCHISIIVILKPTALPLHISMFLILDPGPGGEDGGTITGLQINWAMNIQTNSRNIPPSDPHSSWADLSYCPPPG